MKADVDAGHASEPYGSRRRQSKPIPSITSRAA